MGIKSEIKISTCRSHYDTINRDFRQREGGRRGEGEEEKARGVTT